MALEWKPFQPQAPSRLTPIKVQNNRRIMAGLPLPDTLGTPLQFDTFINSPYWQSVLRLYMASTDEKKHLIEFLNSQLIPSLIIHERMLDIGAGNGRLCRAVAPAFAHATLIERDPDLVAAFVADDFKREGLGQRPVGEAQMPPWEIVCGPFPKVNTGHYPFNLVLMSHMLYYDLPKDWPKIVYSAYNKLAAMGKAVVVWHGDEGQDVDMVSHFGGKHAQIEPLVTACYTLFSHQQVELVTLPTIQRTSTAQDMTHLAGFFFLDSGITVPTPAILEYVEAHFKQADGTYAMEHPDRVIVIRRD